ncbi:MAG TPA: hypothetical protein DCW55_02050 [Candidatus Pacebacteria bacterium]|nr:hypothetical protein [Candidatus Paceibacterota bacterium]
MMLHRMNKTLWTKLLGVGVLLFLVSANPSGVQASTILVGASAHADTSQAPTTISSTAQPLAEMFMQLPIKNEDFKSISSIHGNGHRGIDIRANQGSSIYPFQAGVVSTIGYDGDGYGHYIVITHDDGLTSLYAHMQKSTETKLGERVSLLTELGLVGMSGRTTGSHLHFEIVSKDGAVNPGSLLNLKK